MVNPQLEDGYTMIANEILEALAKINLSPYESRVLHFIIRKTYGWHKKSDLIPLSQIAQGTGIPKHNVSRALKSLSARNVIIKDKKRIGFQKDYTKWIRKLSKPITTKKSSAPITSIISSDNKALSAETPQNKRKKFLQKKGREAPLLAHQRDLFKILKRCSAIKDSDASKLPELLADYPDVDHGLEFKKFLEYWSGRNLKRPWLALRNWLERAPREAIQSPGGKRYGRPAENRHPPKFNVEVIKSGEDENEK